MDGFHALKDMDLLSGIANATGLTDSQREWLVELVAEWREHTAHNNLVRRYFEGNVKVSDYGAGANEPCDQTCYWPAKAVDALAERVRMERLTFSDGLDDELLTAMGGAESIVDEYNRHVSSKYLYGCMAATVTRANGRAKVRFHTAETFTAIPSADMESGQVAAGLAIARRERTEYSKRIPVPTRVNLFLPNNTVQLDRISQTDWVAHQGEHDSAEPAMYVFAHKAVGETQPFGRTRINKFVRTITDDAIRCLWHMQISGAYYSVPKLLMLNLTADQYDAIRDNKDKFQLDKVLIAEQNADGSTAQVSQLSGNSPQPFIDELMALAKQFSGITSVPLNSLGIVQDNPSSAEAIGAAREDICLVAEQDIKADARVMHRVMLAALAQQRGCGAVDELPEHARTLQVRFAQPMLHSMGERSNFVAQFSAARPGFAQTDVAAEMVGIPPEDIERVKSDEARNAAAAMASSIFGG